MKIRFLVGLMVILLGFTSYAQLFKKNKPSAVKISEKWNSPEIVGGSVNSDEWEDGPSISPEGNVLYFTRGKDRDVATYLARKTDQGWGTPEALAEINLATFPTGGPHSQDDSILYFASIRPGGVGEGDIYVCNGLDSRWGGLTNLGEPINTPQMESEPFISLDQQTLYFASNRNGGVGDLDIWMATREAELWSEPINLGAPVNTSGLETQPFVTEDGQELYFMAVDRDGIPGPAIFQSIKVGEQWGEAKVVVSGLVGEPTLTSDKNKLYFVHIILKGSKLVDAEIMFSTKK